MSTGPIIGIDLGTAYSCVGVFQNGKVVIIPNDIGERTTPSYVAFNNSEILIGDAAKNQITRNPTNTLFDIMRFIGRKFEDREIKEGMKLWPFKVVKDIKSERPLFQINYKNQEKEFYAEEILSMILQRLRQTASKFLGKEVRDAIVTVPAYFNNSQRQSIKDAGTISGLNILRIYSGSTVAAITYGFEEKNKNYKNVLIFDLGAGNLSVSLLTLEEGLFDVKATNGNINLGGEDFVNRLVDYCVEEFKNKTNIDIKNNMKALMRVRRSCESAKRALSAATQATVDIDCLINDEDMNIVITRTKFEDLCMDLFQKCIPIIENVLKDARMNKSQIDEIVLVGGSTRIPKIQQIVQEFFNGKELYKNINPDEADAYGAAIYAAVMTHVKDKSIERIILLDAIPFSLGIETVGGVMTLLIPRNYSLPAKKTYILSTYNDSQTSVIIKIFEGERQLTKDNYLLGTLILDDIPPMPRGKAQIEITFDIDANSIFHVSAVEKLSGKQNKMVITNDRERLGKYRFIEENKIFQEEDKIMKERIEAKNCLERYCYELKLTLDDAKSKDKISENEKKQINDKIDEALKWSNENSLASKEEYVIKLREIIFNPIIAKIK